MTVTLLPKAKKQIGIPLPPLADISRPKFQQFGGAIGTAPKPFPDRRKEDKKRFLMHGEA